MIVDGKVSVVRVFLDLGRAIVFILTISVAITLAYEATRSHWLSISPVPLTIIGAALSIFLAFRNNTVYDRWWEGRTLWGALINQSRTFARQLQTFGIVSDETEREAMEAWQRRIILRHIGYVNALRQHLRSEDPCAPGILDPFVSSEEIAEYRQASNKPAAILHRQGEELHTGWRHGWLKDFHISALDATLTEFTNVQGGCERIKNTPLPPVYTYLAYRIVVTFCCLVPLGLVADLRLFTPFVSVLIGFTFLILNRISQLIEMPFAMDDNDLPLSALSRLIEIDLRERIGATPIPEPIKPQNGVLL